MTIETRQYGDRGPLVVVLHGGPGAPGYMAPLALGLASSFRVLEPLQRRSGGAPLTVARHVADLHDLLSSRGDGRPALVGHSWGAMLALAYAAVHPCVASVALIGCGTFDAVARERMHAILGQRTDDALRRRLDSLADELPDPDEQLRAFGALLLPVYSYDPIVRELGGDACDARGHNEAWADMVRLQREGVYPAAFAAIGAPVVMLHGAQDPHPGPLIRASLEPHLPQLEYREWERCGHYPWLESAVRDDFLAFLSQWLARHSLQGSAASNV